MIVDEIVSNWRMDSTMLDVVNLEMCPPSFALNLNDGDGSLSLFWFKQLRLS